VTGAPEAPSAPARPWTGRWFWWLVAALVAVRIISLVGVLLSGQELPDSILGGDARRYAQIVTAEGTPYADFEVEYPPAALALIRLTYQPDHFVQLVLLGLSQLAIDLACAALLGWAWGRRSALAYLLMGLPFLVFPFIWLRIDMLSVLLAVLGVALAARGRDGRAGAVLAVAVFAKLWPIAIAPLFLVERRWRGLWAWAATGLACGVAWIAWAGVTGPIQVFSFRGAIGWQVESFTGILLHIDDADRANVEQGAWRTGTMPWWSRPVLSVLSFSFVGLCWWWAARRRRDGAGELTVLALAPYACVLALLIFAPIISPQYLLWLLPFAALLAAHGDRVTGGLMVVAGFLSTLELALIHDQIDGRWWATAPVVARNAVLVVMLVMALQQLAGLASSVACGIRRRPSDPVLAAEVGEQHAGEHQHRADGDEEADALAGAGQLHEVHAVDAGDDVGTDQDRTP
jgi:hypothetical protein